MSCGAPAAEAWEPPAHYKTRAGILCFREASPVELLLVSRRKHCDSVVGRESVELPPAEGCQSFAIPAGKIESSLGETYRDCAVRELLEEAGVECECLGDLGWYESKSKHDEPKATKYFLGRCLKLLETWPEDHERERVWFTEHEALQRVEYREDFRAVIQKGMQMLQEKFNAGKPRAQEVNDSLVFTCYSKQAGGHFCMLKPSQRSNIEIDPPSRGHTPAEHFTVQGGRVLLKPFDQSEFRFYCERADKTLRPYLAHCYGTRTLRREQLQSLADNAAASGSSPQSKNLERQTSFEKLNKNKSAVCVDNRPVHDRKYIVLEDCAGSLQHPCFIDLKMGCRQRAAHHSQQKRAHMAKKAARTTSQALGFRICGFHCLDPNDKSSHVRYDKYWGQKVTVAGMCEALALFFCPPRSSWDCSTEPACGFWRPMLDEIILKLTGLYEVVERLPGFRFWGSSILVGFDGTYANEGQLQALATSVQVKLIDFSNFQLVNADRPDLEFLCGLRNLLIHLQALTELSAAEASEAVASSRVQPPTPEVQDAEQDRAWRELHPDPFPDPFGIGDSDNPDKAHEDNLAANASTVSGATGRLLMRELASKPMMESPIEERTLESPNRRRSCPLDALFPKADDLFANADEVLTNGKFKPTLEVLFS